MIFVKEKEMPRYAGDTGERSPRVNGDRVATVVKRRAFENGDDEVGRKSSRSGVAGSYG